MSRYRPLPLCPLRLLGIALLLLALPLWFLSVPFGPGPLWLPVRNATLLPSAPLTAPVEEIFQSRQAAVARIGVYFATGLPQNGGPITVQVAAWEPPQGWVTVGNRRFPPGSIGNNTYGMVTLQPNGATRYRLDVTGLGADSATTVWTLPPALAALADAGSFPAFTVGGQPFPGTLALNLEWTGRKIPLWDALSRGVVRAANRASRAWALDVPANGVLILASVLLAGLAALILSLVCGRL